LQVSDPFGRTVRTVAYYQHPDPKHTVDTPTRITASKALFGGRISQRWDPRLFSKAEKDRTVTPNFVDWRSLSGRPLLSESVDAGWRLTLWNATGQPFLSWDGRNTRTQHIYDALQRPRMVLERLTTEPKNAERYISRIRYMDKALEPEVIARNLRGQPVQIDDGAGTLRVDGYSLHGAPLNETRQFLQELDEPNWSREVPLEVGQGATTTWRYNALGELLSQTDAAGNTQSSEYDVAGRLCTSALQLAGKRPQVLVSGIQYNAFGQIETETTGNGVVNESIYCPKTGRLTRLSAKRAGEKACLQDLNYAYDPVGNILSIEDKSRPVQHCANQCIEPLRTFAYDSLDQLVVASGWEVRKPNRGPALPAYQGPCLDASQLTNYTEFYRYDAAGNLQALRHVSPHPYTRNLITAKGSNRSLLAFKTEVTEAILASAFDANGNLEKLQPGGQTLQWDPRNQLRQVSPVLRGNGLHDTEDYIYDHTGKRVRKVSRRQASGAELIADVRYLPGLEIRTNSATGEVLHVISAPAGRSSARVLHWQQVPPKDLQNQQLRYSLDDHLGSSTLELDDQAQVLSQEGYFPYGGTAWWAASNQTEAKYKTIRYSGKERDATGLYYYGFRYYAPWLGRWINPDPAGTVDGLNLYRMVRNNPILFNDKNGLTPSSDRERVAELDNVRLEGIAILEHAIEILRNNTSNSINQVLSKFFNLDNTEIDRTAFADDIEEIITVAQQTNIEHHSYFSEEDLIAGLHPDRFDKARDSLLNNQEVKIKYLAINKKQWDDHKKITGPETLSAVLIHEFSHAAIETVDLVYETAISGFRSFYNLFLLPQGKLSQEFGTEYYKNVRTNARLTNNPLPYSELAYSNADSFALAALSLSFSEGTLKQRSWYLEHVLMAQQPYTKEYLDGLKKPWLKELTRQVHPKIDTSQNLTSL